MAEPGGGAQAPGPDEVHQEYFFQDLLDEVYLLLDFVSGNCAKKLDELTNVWVPGSGASSTKPETTPAQIIEHIARIRYPPTGDVKANAEDAAFLLLVKDRLTRMSAPAYGMTIAYTKMLVSRDDSRTVIAMRAFDGLQKSAQRFRKWIMLCCIPVLLVLTFLTFYTAYVAATGRSVLQRLEDIAQSRGRVTELIRTAEARGGEAATDNGRLCPGLAPPGGDPERWVDQQLAAIKSPTVRALCDQQVNVERQWARAAQDLTAYQARLLYPYELVLSRFLWLSYADPKPPPDALPGTPPDPRTAVRSDHRETEQWIAAMVSALATAVLPWLFTLLGTGVSILRDILGKVHESTLAPRDLPLSFARLALGMVAGAAIGLFFSPTELPLGAGVGGSIAISVAGLVFLAGYGVDSVFAMFDTILRRLAAGVESGGGR